MIELRQATPEDIDLLCEMIMEIAAYLGQQSFVKTSKTELLNAGFGENPLFEAIIAEYEGTTAGYVSYTINYSIWLGVSYINIDDVFVKAAFRGKKIGQALMQEIRKLSKEKGIQRVKWEVEKENTAAIRFYEKLGATVSIKGLCSWDLS
ncbi:MAG: GNAT family N-acetyltransferase [Roseivirga sp.]